MMIKNFKTLFLICIAFVVTLSQCCKENPLPEPDIFGEWTTLSVIGEKWEYRIKEDGDFCQTNPNFTAWFCFPFAQGDHSATVNKGNGVIEIWKFVFECYDVASVTVTIDGDITQTLVLKRRK